MKRWLALPPAQNRNSKRGVIFRVFFLSLLLTNLGDLALARALAVLCSALAALALASAAVAAPTLALALDPALAPALVLARF